MPQTVPVFGVLKPNHFVAISEGDWTSGATFNEALGALHKRVGTKKVKATIFASTAPMTLEFDVYARATAEPGHVLIQFQV